jgi:hypothetical protein
VPPNNGYACPQTEGTSFSFWYGLDREKQYVKLNEGSENFFDQHQHSWQLAQKAVENFLDEVLSHLVKQ